MTPGDEDRDEARASSSGPGVPVMVNSAVFHVHESRLSFDDVLLLAAEARRIILGVPSGPIRHDSVVRYCCTLPGGSEVSGSLPKIPGLNVQVDVVPGMVFYVAPP